MAGSVSSAVTEITQTAAVQKADSEEKVVDSLRDLTVAKDPASLIIRAWLRPAGKEDLVNHHALQTWLNNQPEAYLKAIPVGTFAFGGLPDHDLAPIRQRAVDDPRLNIPH